MTTNSILSISFTGRANRKSADYLDIYVRVTVNGKRTEFSLVSSVPKISWDLKKERVNSKSNDFRSINNYIDNVRAQLVEIHRTLILNKEFITPQIIKNQFIGNIEQAKTLNYLIDYHNKSQDKMLGPGTLAHYLTTSKYLKQFLVQCKKVDDILLKNIDYKFLVDFEYFIRSYQPTGHAKPMSHNVVMKHLCRLRKLLNFALRMEWIDNNPFKKFKITYKKVDRGFLTDTDIRAIRAKEFSIERLDYVRDLFIFACYTGLAYVDVQQLTSDNIVIGIDGGRWIQTKRKKTETSLNIPILPIADSVISKYKDHPNSLHCGKLFPPISNQKLNSYLKEIADVCGIKKNLTFHLARHTFATTITLSNGVPIETVSKILGHTKLATTQIYAHVLKNKISEDMLTLKNKLDSSNPSMDESKSAL